MRSPTSTCADAEPSRRRRLPAVIAAAFAGVLLLPPASGRAAPAAPDDPGAKLERLEKRARALSKEYHGRLYELEDATRTARRAATRVRDLARQRSEARDRVAELAAARYKGGRIDPIIVLATSDTPQGVLDRAAIAEHLARTDDDRIRDLQGLERQADQAQREARTQLDRAKSIADRLESRRAEVTKLVAKYRAEDAARKRRAARAAARREAEQREAAQREAAQREAAVSAPAPAPHPQSPLVGDEQITSRMRQVLTEVDGRFGPFPTIGCYRPGTFGEHPLGRACDFMLSTGGTMPSAANVDRGWEVANWARANASRLGVMYVIYRQQIWDSRSGGGWRPMEDRGSITQNHYDHVHISVF